MQEFKDIITGLEQRIQVYKSKLQDLQKRRDKIDGNIKTVKKYLELAETLCRVEIAKGKGGEALIRRTPGNDIGSAELEDKTDIILLEKSKYVGLSVPHATYLLLKELGEPIHAKEIHKKLIKGGIRMRGKTPITSIAISLSRDKRFKKVAPNTFGLAEDVVTDALTNKMETERR
ncbi:MAG: winged helix-turn-helix domain-containing protein [Waddliaceae bacterium]